MIDTSVVVAAARSRRGASSRLLLSAADGKLKVLVTTAVFLEYEAVLSRPEQRLAHGYSLAEIDALLRGMSIFAEPVELKYASRPQMRDADDEMIFEAAYNGNADAIVTFNRRDFLLAKEFGIDVLLPAETLNRIER